MTEFDPDILSAPAWFSDDDEEMRDAERVGVLEDNARATDDPLKAAEWLAEADELREQWREPRRRFGSVAEIIAELQAIALAACQLDISDAVAVFDLAFRASSAARGLAGFALDLESAAEEDEP